jgi:hypothetical protein
MKATSISIRMRGNDSSTFSHPGEDITDVGFAAKKVYGCFLLEQCAVLGIAQKNHVCCRDDRNARRGKLGFCRELETIAAQTIGHI